MYFRWHGYEAADTIKVIEVIFIRIRRSCDRLRCSAGVFGGHFADGSMWCGGFVGVEYSVTRWKKLY